MAIRRSTWRSIEPLDGLTVGAPEVPTPTQRLRVPGVDDELMVYADSVRVSVPLLITKSLGETSLQIRVTYQACDETVATPRAARG
jgi:hypothetical protein